MKKVFLILCVMFSLFGVCLVSGCGKAEVKTINVSVSSKLSRYNVSTHTEGSTVEDKIVYCGERYKLSFNFDFTNIEEILKEKETINVTMTVRLGAYENEDNKELLNSKYIPDGLSFNSHAKGEWEATFALSRDDKPDFEKGYFIVGVDTLGLGEDSGMGEYEKIEVTFTARDGNVEFKFNGSSEYTTSLLPTKGNFEFTQKNNIVTQIGAEAQRNNMTIAIPAKCGEIVIDFYEDASKAKIYGTERFDSETNADIFKENMLSLIVSDYVKEYLGTGKYDEMLSMGEIPIYLVITAVGGNNYNDGVIEMYFNVN